MYYILAIIVGFIVSLQSGLNKQIGTTMGLSPALILTGLGTLTGCLIFYFLIRFQVLSGPDFLQDRDMWAQMKAWYVIPGILGFFIIAGFPFLIAKIGATSVFLLAIVGQITMSLIWDYFVEKIPINSSRIFAVCLCAIGAYLSTKSD